MNNTLYFRSTRNNKYIKQVVLRQGNIKAYNN